MQDSDGRDDANDFTASEQDDFANSLAALSLRNQRKQIRHELTDPYNRLHSIALDSDFVKAVSDVYPDFAVVPNLRCGAWYVDPSGQQTVQRNVYFKSMDGHAGEWKFPLRRPNFPFLDVIIQYGGAIIVDSTRRGKRFPDALSKTVPIWCAVVNKAVYTKMEPKPDWTPEDLDIYTASASVGESERDQIRSRLDGWARDLHASSYTLPSLKKPLRPLHISPSSRLPDTRLRSSAFETFYPVICLSASRYTSGGSSERYGSFNYVPGSGDDHEGWVPSGFGPEHFWANRKDILDASREDMYGLMERLATSSGSSQSSARRTETNERPTSEMVWIANTKVGYSFGTSGSQDPNVHIIHIASHSSSSNGLIVPEDPKKHLPYFTAHIGEVESGVADALSKGHKVQIEWNATPTSNERDIGIGIMLVALTLHFDDSFKYIGVVDPERITKATVSRRLEWIIAASQGKLNPSKKILKRVNDYLFSR